MEGPSQPPFQFDSTLGSLRLGNFVEVSPGLAHHFNTLARASQGVLPSEYVDFAPGHYSTVGIPIAPVSLSDCLTFYDQLRLVFDGQISVDLAECPRWFSRLPGQPSIIRGLPTYVPASRFQEDFFNRSHSVELFHAGSSLYGPVERFMHGPGAGVIAEQVEDGLGMLTARLRGDLSHFATGSEAARFLVVDTDPVFGLPAEVFEVLPQSRKRLTYTLLGLDCVGETLVFNNGVVRGFSTEGDALAVEIRLPNRGCGFASVRGPGYTTKAALRPDAKVS